MNVEDKIYPYAKLFFRAGFASIFLVNAIVAVVTPGDFTKLITGNIIGQYFPEVVISPMGWFIAFNDLILGILILLNKWKVFVYGWAGIWLLVIAGIKVTNLIWHVG